MLQFNTYESPLYEIHVVQYKKVLVIFLRKKIIGLSFFCILFSKITGQFIISNIYFSSEITRRICILDIKINLFLGIQVFIFY